MADPKTAKDAPRSKSSWKLFGLLVLTFVYVSSVYWLNSGPIKVPQIPSPRLAPRPLSVCGYPVRSNPLINVMGSKSYVVTPYVEHRGEEKEIRAISIVNRHEFIKFNCLLCCGGKEFSVTANLNVHSDHFGYDYCTGDILCPIPQGCEAPEHVAIFSSTMEGREGWKPSVIPVLNQKPKSSDFNFTFTICISPMHKNYNNLLQVVQAMEMYRLLGVQRVVVYKINCGPDVQKVLDYYEKKGFVEVIPWDVTSYISVSSGWQRSESPGDLHYYGQIPALNDCVYRYMYRTEYVALHDIDELILPLKVENWSQLLKQLEQEHFPGMGFEFENHVFPITVSDEADNYRPEDWGNVSGVNVLEHILREPNIPGQFNDFKVIVNPRSVFETTVHGFLRSLHGSVRVSTDLAHIYHVRKTRRPDLPRAQLIRDDRIRAYAARLMPAVSEVLKNVKKNTV
ncbi:hypothetical protein AGOR_G00122980 [Albula goreensis]|uniref:Glycosyltransferase family 92 protein n=1 Tax=Albula goreensis TaxID=1534307 RepID=A0A8T3DG05_9TELE|nr:hypothetical protein AGOR_G00122980 [Albula goreensis]